MNAIDFTHILQGHGYKVRTNRSQCPAHGGKNLSLSFSDGTDGKLLMTCFSNHCTPDAIANALGLSISDFFPPANDNDFNITDWKQKRSQLEFNKECIKAYRIVAIFSGDIKSKKTISQEDKDAAREAMALLNKHHFSHKKYNRLMKERALNTAHTRFNSLFFDERYGEVQ